MTSFVEEASPVREARLLLREYSHRINNEFASAISVVSLAAMRSTTDEAKCTLAAVKERLFNYALVHHALEMPERSVPVDGAAYIRDLCRAISRAKLASQGIGLVLKEQSFQIQSERCWRLGLIISELITNSARHAFAGRGGVIRIDVSPSTSFVECRVVDDGRGELGARTGHGLKIVTALAHGLGGTFRQHFGSQGATSILIFPLDRG